MAYPVTGETLLVGTQRHDGEGVPVRRHLVDFTLLPTWLGVVVAPASDRVALRSVQEGFLVSANPGQLTLVAAISNGRRTGPRGRPDASVRFP